MLNPKFLQYRRHSIKDGKTKNTIGPNGLHLANRTGVAEARAGIKRLFHGPFVRTAQTALAFCGGLGYVPEVMPIIEGIGNDDLFAEIATATFIEAVKGGASHLEALHIAYSSEFIRGLGSQSLQCVRDMFAQMQEGEVSVAFGHSPFIELAAITADPQLDVASAPWVDLKEMQGFLFVFELDGNIAVRTKLQSAARDQ